MPARADGPQPPAHALPGWPDDRFHRLAALALLEELRSALLSENSATLILERWCGAHRLGGAVGPATVLAERDERPDPGLAPADRALLRMDAGEAVGYRHVRLTCNGHLLSEADNWYVPARLTADMKRQLDSSDIPFGKVVRALGFSRATLSSRLLWHPLPPDWIGVPGPAAAGRMLDVPASLMETRALLRRRDGMPFSLVAETYRRGLLDFAAPPGP